jgi:hypothetical protein
MILLANAKTRLVLNESSQHSERENRIRQQYPYPVDEWTVELGKKSTDWYTVMDEEHRTPKRCIAGILSPFGLPCKREDRSRQSGQSWKEAGAL